MLVGEREIGVGGTVKNHKSDEGALVPVRNEREGGGGSVEETNRGVCKNGMTVGSEEGGDADKRVGQSRVREEVARDRRDFVRKRKFAVDVGGTTDRQDRAIKKGKRQARQRLGREKGA
jgi:hypothetical protein